MWHLNVAAIVAYMTVPATWKKMGDALLAVAGRARHLLTAYLHQQTLTAAPAPSRYAA